MNSTERVRRTILGQDFDRQPVYGWVSANLEKPITAAYGSVAAFEDAYEFDMAHIFGGPAAFNRVKIQEEIGDEELTPDIALEYPLSDPDSIEAYEGMRAAIEHHKQRERFCYVQTPGFFEQYNDMFGIENHLGYLCEYGDEIAELYHRQAQWTKKFARNCLDLGADMIHISDDWGSQKDMLFSPRMWKTLIYPNLKEVADYVHGEGALVSLHSDGCVKAVTDGVADIGINLMHPWQESAGMSYETWLQKYSDRIAIMGGICIQTTLGFGDFERLESEIRRVFRLLRGKRWCVCTSHFVQDHCSIEELRFAYDLIYKLSRQP